VRGAGVIGPAASASIPEGAAGRAEPLLVPRLGGIAAAVRAAHGGERAASGLPLDLLALVAADLATELVGDRPVGHLPQLAPAHRPEALLVLVSVCGLHAGYPVMAGRSPEPIGPVLLSGQLLRSSSNPSPPTCERFLRRPLRRRSRARSARTPGGLTAAGTARFCTQVGRTGSAAAQIARGYPIRPRARLRGEG
jgi:hypothetical protein